MLVGDYLLVVAWVVEDAAVCRITPLIYAPIFLPQKETSTGGWLVAFNF